MKLYLLKRYLFVLALLGVLWGFGGCSSYEEIDESENDGPSSLQEPGQNSQEDSYEFSQDSSQYLLELVSVEPEGDTKLYEKAATSDQGSSNKVSSNRSATIVTSPGYLNITVVLLDAEGNPLIHEKINFFIRNPDSQSMVEASFIQSSPEIFSDKNGEAFITLRTGHTPSHFEVFVETQYDVELILPFRVEIREKG